MFFSCFSARRNSFYFYCCCNQEGILLPTCDQSSFRFPEKTFDIITWTVKIDYKLLMIIYVPQLKDQGKLQNSFDITLGEWRNSWYHFKLPSCHFTPIFKNCANCSLHIFRIWFLWLLFSINSISFAIGIKNQEIFLLHFSSVLIRFLKVNEP